MRFHAESTRDAYDVVVIGAGMGGLTAAALLARAGRSVLVVERHDRVGGYAHSFRRGPYLFDSAVHLVGGCEPVPYEGGGVLHQVLEALEVRDRVEFERIDPCFEAVFPGQRFAAPGDLDELERRLADAFPTERKGLRDFLQECLNVRIETQRASELAGPYEVMRRPGRFPTLLRYRRATLAQALDAHVGSRELRAGLSAPWPYLGLPPSRVSFLYFATMLMSYVADRSYYCRGSFQRLADALAGAISDRGGEVLLRSGVRRIRIDAGRARGITLENGQRIDAPVVLSNADASQTILELSPEHAFPARYVRRLRRMRPSLSALVAYGATDLPLDRLPIRHETFYYPSLDADACYASSLTGRPDWFSMTVPTLADPSLAPEGQHLFVLTTLVPYEVPGGWRDEKERAGQRLIDLAEAQVPGLREALRFSEFASPRTMERYTRNSEGAIYGFELSPSQVGPGRLGSRTPVSGLHLTGHWTQPGGGVYGVVSSGIQAARAVLGVDSDARLWRTLQA
jgi:prolycopene isomerase